MLDLQRNIFSEQKQIRHFTNLRLHKIQQQSLTVSKIEPQVPNLKLLWQKIKSSYRQVQQVVVYQRVPDPNLHQCYTNLKTNNKRMRCKQRRWLQTSNNLYVFPKLVFKMMYVLNFEL